MKPQIAIVKCPDYNPELVQVKVKQALDSLGGMANFIRPESRVLVKPNLLMAKEPEAAVTTHPEVLRAVIKLLKTLNCRIFVGDGPSVWGKQIENVDEVYARTGIKQVCLEEQVELVKFDKRRWRGKFPLTTWLDSCDYFINLPKFKTHEFTTLTAAIKNLFGLVSGTYKTELHKKFFSPQSFSEILVDIYEEAKPALTVVDAIDVMEGDGPGTAGKPRHCGLLLAGVDCLAIDSVLAKIMGLEPMDILTNKIAAQRKLGASDIREIEILGENLSGLNIQPFVLPATSIRSKVPQPIINFAKKFIRYLPKAYQENCIRCGACIKACPQKIINLKKGMIVIRYQGCISCFCCQEVCPQSAIKVKKSLFAKLIGL
ncbi:MAG: DUF362 domain-containing protein [Candidatus Omnitrophota bacterium]